VSFWDVVLSIVWFMILFTWVWMLIAIFGDILRDHELSGWAKAVWTVFLVVLPWIGALTYLIVRGRSMNERARARAQLDNAAFEQYVRQAAGGSGPTGTAEEIGKLAELRDRGAISAEEFTQAKARLLGGSPAPADPVGTDRERPVPAAT